VKIAVAVVVLSLGLLTPLAGERAWWIMPLLVFAISLLLVLLDGRRPLSARWVLGAAGVAVAMGAFLRVRENDNFGGVRATHKGGL
jgi:nitrate/nitrite transporter NarK